MKAVVCGSFSNLGLINKVIEQLKEEGYDVFPSEEWFEFCKYAIHMTHKRKEEDKRSLYLKYQAQRIYAHNVMGADLIYFVNEKNGKEYYGVGSTIELGIALVNYLDLEFEAERPKIRFHRPPTDPNIRAWFEVSVFKGIRGKCPNCGKVIPRSIVTTDAEKPWWCKYCTNSFDDEKVEIIEE